jgi:hypothetical protein
MLLSSSPNFNVAHLGPQLTTHLMASCLLPHLPLDDDRHQEHPICISTQHTDQCRRKFNRLPTCLLRPSLIGLHIHHLLMVASLPTCEK